MDGLVGYLIVLSPPPHGHGGFTPEPSLVSWMRSGWPWSTVNTLNTSTWCILEVFRMTLRVDGVARRTATVTCSGRKGTDPVLLTSGSRLDHLQPLATKGARDHISLAQADLRSPLESHSWMQIFESVPASSAEPVLTLTVYFCAPLHRHCESSQSHAGGGESRRCARASFTRTRSQLLLRSQIFSQVLALGRDAWTCVVRSLVELVHSTLQSVRDRDSLMMHLPTADVGIFRDS
jgi:hypothetical protein